jgi:hypothetical protein
MSCKDDNSSGGKKICRYSPVKLLLNNLEIGSLKLETGNWKLESRSWNLSLPYQNSIGGQGKFNEEFCISFSRGV